MTLNQLLRSREGKHDSRVTGSNIKTIISLQHTLLILTDIAEHLHINHNSESSQPESNNLASDKSQEYYEEIDKEMAKLFPPDQSNSNVQTVAPVNGRASVKTGRKQRVVLTESERRTADRLGVPYEKYAQQKLKLQKGA